MALYGLAEDIKGRSGGSIFLGVQTALLDFFLVGYPMATATITTLLLGWVLIFVAIAQNVFALHSWTVGTFFAKVLLATSMGLPVLFWRSSRS